MAPLRGSWNTQELRFLDLRSGSTLQLAGEFFNVFNRSRVDNLITNLNDPRFGEIHRQRRNRPRASAKSGCA